MLFLYTVLFVPSLCCCPTLTSLFLAYDRKNVSFFPFSFLRFLTRLFSASSWIFSLPTYVVLFESRRFEKVYDENLSFCCEGRRGMMDTEGMANLGRLPWKVDVMQGSCETYNLSSTYNRSKRWWIECATDHGGGRCVEVDGTVWNERLDRFLAYKTSFFAPQDQPFFPITHPSPLSNALLRSHHFTPDSELVSVRRIIFPLLSIPLSPPISEDSKRDKGHERNPGQTVSWSFPFFSLPLLSPCLPLSQHDDFNFLFSPRPIDHAETTELEGSHPPRRGRVRARGCRFFRERWSLSFLFLLPFLLGLASLVLPDSPRTRTHIHYTPLVSCSASTRRWRTRC